MEFGAVPEFDNPFYRGIFKESLVVGQNWLVDGPTKRVMSEYQSILCEGLRISSQPLMIKSTKHGNHQMWLHNITQLYKLHKSSNAAVDLNYDECKPLEIKNIAMWCSMNMIRVTWNISGYHWVVGSCSALRVQIRNLDCFRGSKTIKHIIKHNSLEVCPKSWILPFWKINIHLTLW